MFSQAYSMYFYMLLRQWRARLNLALPLIFTHILGTSLGFVDTLVAGTISTQSLAALAAANGLFWAVICIFEGLLNGIDTYVARAYGAQDFPRMDRLLGRGVWLALAASLVTVIVVVALGNLYVLIDIDPAVLELVWSYLWWILPSAPFILLNTLFQKYWQAQGWVRPFTVLMLILNMLNFCFDYGFAHGIVVPALGVDGIALSTVVCRLLAFGFCLWLSVHLWGRSARQRLSTMGLFKWRSTQSRAELYELWRFGLPCLGHYTVDIAVFNGLTVVASVFGIISLASHQLLFMLLCVVLMVPIGIAHASSIEIGHSLGRGNTQAALHLAKAYSRATFIILMSITFGLYCTAPWLAGLLSADHNVVFAMVPLIQLLAFIQFIDGLQMLYVYILRAFGCVKPIFHGSVLGHYAVGVPISLWCGFGLRLGVYGLWLGIAAALSFIWLWNYMTWRRQIVFRDVSIP